MLKKFWKCFLNGEERPEPQPAPPASEPEPKPVDRPKLSPDALERNAVFAYLNSNAFAKETMEEAELMRGVEIRRLGSDERFESIEAALWRARKRDLRDLKAYCEWRDTVVIKPLSEIVYVEREPQDATGERLFALYTQEPHYKGTIPKRFGHLQTDPVHVSKELQAQAITLERRVNAVNQKLRLRALRNRMVVERTLLYPLITRDPNSKIKLAYTNGIWICTSLADMDTSARLIVIDTLEDLNARLMKGNEYNVLK